MTTEVQAKLSECDMSQDEWDDLEIRIQLYIWEHGGPVFGTCLDGDITSCIVQAFRAYDVDENAFMTVLRTLERRRLVRRRVLREDRLVLYTHETPAMQPVLMFYFSAT